MNAYLVLPAVLGVLAGLELLAVQRLLVVLAVGATLGTIGPIVLVVPIIGPIYVLPTSFQLTGPPGRPAAPGSPGAPGGPENSHTFRRTSGS